MQPVDPRSRDPKWYQVAEQIRNQIISGRWEPGHHLPGNEDLAHETDTSVPTVRRALRSLAAEELIVTEQGVRAQVATPRERRMVSVRPGDRIKFRPATPDEQRQHGLAEGADVAEVTDAGGVVGVFPARAVEFVVEAED